ncbi:MAG TPA: enoyl-CoA hydratase/isomerase family protein, partial [Terriglobales bacterium]|nr:enoyl-CoA hydratase/isomerase family protein [Terriglobales bacterium]
MHVDALPAQEPLVLTSHANRVATLTLNRGGRFNPLSSQMIAAIQAELNAIAKDPSVRVVILAAEGKGFSA